MSRLDPIFQVTIIDLNGHTVALSPSCHDGLDSAYEALLDMYPAKDYLVTQSDEDSRLFFIDNRRAGSMFEGIARIVGYELRETNE